MRVLGIWLVGLVLAVPVCGASAQKPEPPAEKKLTPEQQAKLKERDAAGKQARELREAGKPKEAVAPAERMLAIELELYGETHLDVAGSLELLYELYEEVGDYPKAIKTADRWVAVVVGLYGADHWRVKTVRVEAGLVAIRSRWTPAHREKERAMVNDRADGLALYRARKEDEALAKFERAAKASAELYGDNHPHTNTDLQNLAVALHAADLVDRAEAVNRKVIANWKAAVGDKHPAYADALNNLGAMFLADRRFLSAKPILEEATAVRKAAYGERSAPYAQSLNNLAGFYFEVHDYPAAIERFKESLLVFRATVGENDREVTNTLANLSRVYATMGEEAKALEMRLLALDQVRKRAGDKQPVFAYHAKGVALLYWKLGDRRAAVEHLEKACEIYRAAKLDGREEYADAVDSLANIVSELGDPERAAKLYAEALAIRKKRSGETSVAYSHSLHNLGVHHMVRREYDRAMPLLEESLALKQLLLGRFAPDTIQTAGQLASAYMVGKTPDPDKARALFADALEGDRQQVERSALAQSEMGRLATVRRFRLTLDNCVMSFHDTGSDITWLYRHCLTWKGAVFTRQTLVRRFRTENPGAATDLFARLDDSAAELARLWHRPTAEQTGEWAAEVRAASWKREIVEEEISRRMSAAKVAPLPNPTPDDVRKALPPGTALVDFWDNGNHLFAFITRPNHRPVIVDLKQSKAVAQAVAEWRGGVTGPVPKGNPGADLRKLIWEPLLPHLGDAHTVLISPDGAVGQLPFAALPGAKPGTFLIEELAISVIPVPQLLPALVAPVKFGPPNLLASGDVSFSLPSPDAGKRGSWPALPGTRGEVEGVTGTFRQAFPAATLTEFTREKATAQAVRAQLPRARFVHFATHGFFSEGAGNAVSGFAHPGVMNGLVFAGANDPAHAEGGGLLTALGLAGLDLAGTELVVLSACETGLGRLAGGEGVLGLQRAFQVAGAHSTITSLWQVDDTATRALMERFYQNLWDKKMGKLEALREAQLWMLKEGKKDAGVARGLRKVGVPKPADDGRLPPYFWAAFVLAGDWR